MFAISQTGSVNVRVQQQSETISKLFNIKLLIVVILCTPVCANTATTVITQDEVIVTTNSSVLHLPKTFPNLQYYARTKSGNQTTQGFFTYFSKLVERDVSGNVVGQFNLDNSSTVYEIEYREEVSPIVNINYTVNGGVGKIIFFIFKEDTLAPRSNYTFPAGAVKFSFFFLQCPSKNASKTLPSHAEIAVTTGDLMRQCNVTQPSEFTFNVTTLSCAAKEVEMAFSLLNFGVVLPSDGTPSRFIHVDTRFAVSNNQTALYERLPVDSVYPVLKNGTCGKKIDYPIQKVVLEIVYDSFVNGSLFYDPQLAILLGGGDPNEKDCDSNYSIVSDPLFWLTIAFVIAAIIFILIVISLAQIKYLDRMVRGTESSRISRLRSRRLIRMITKREKMADR